MLTILKLLWLTNVCLGFMPMFALILFIFKLTGNLEFESVKNDESFEEFVKNF